MCNVKFMKNRKVVFGLTSEAYTIIENFMISKMCDSAHDRQHIYRVLYTALDIAETKPEPDINNDVLITACLLHDIGRVRQMEDLSLCHAQIGAEMAYSFLMEINENDVTARHVADCIASHRYRVEKKPASMEAKILFDADKLDAAGVLGIARTLAYGGQVCEPVYIIENNAVVLDGGGAEISSFFQEYHYKLKNVYNHFYTERARQIAEERRDAAVRFYESLLAEVTDTHRRGKELLDLHFRSL